MPNTRKTAKTKGKTAKQTKAPRLTSYAGIPGVYVRHLATGDRLTLRIQIDGKQKTRALDVSPTAPRAEIERAADDARERLLHPVKEMCDYIDDYAIAKDLRPHSVTALKQALRGFTPDDDEQNAKAASAIQTNPDYSQGTKRAYLQRISAFFRWMIETGTRVKNPIAGRKIPKAGEGKEYGFTSDDVARLFDAVDNDGNDEDRLYVRLLRFTGARCSTVYALAPCDFMPMDDGAGFHVQMQNVKCGRPYSIRIPITDGDTCALIRGKLARAKKHLWTATERALHDRLLRRMKNVIGPNASPHGLRHFVACELLKNGVALETISRILDHSSIAITHAIYAKQSQSAIDDALGQL